MNTINYHYQVNKEDIAFLYSYLQAYEGMLALRNPDPSKNILFIMVSPDYKNDFERVVRNLSKKVKMERVNK